jgi:hypothetical protein
LFEEVMESLKREHGRESYEFEGGTHEVVVSTRETEGREKN